MSSTSSVLDSAATTTDPPTTPPLSDDQLNQAALREAEVLREGVRRLGLMTGVKSNHRNLKNEDEAARKHTERHEREISDSPSEDAAMPSEDEMEVMAARDVIVNNNYTTPPAAPAPEPTKPTIPAAVAPAVAAVKAGMPTWVKSALVGTALAGSGLGGAGLAAYFLQPDNVPGQVDGTAINLSTTPK